MPDYHLYDNCNLIKPYDRKEYDECSIGFLTRGCFRGCPFCVNQHYHRSRKWSELKEFMDNDKKRLCFLDDNFLACKDWKEILKEVISTGKPFKFKQGLDERILTDEKAEMLFNSKYDGRFTFAFDNIKDFPIIEEKLKLALKYTKGKRLVFYTLCAFDWKGTWDKSFWAKDIHDLMTRINYLTDHGAYPYVMRFKKYLEAPEPYKSMYINIARWCNQPNLLKKMSFQKLVMRDREHGKALQMYTDYIDLNKNQWKLFQHEYCEG